MVFWSATSEIVMDSDTRAIDAVRETWLAAVKVGDADRMASLVTDDVVVVHGNGRCVQGRNEFKTDFEKAFQSYRIDQQVCNHQTVIRDLWAFDIAEMESTLTPVQGGKATHVVTTTIVALRRQADGSWKVARVLGLSD